MKITNRIRASKMESSINVRSNFYLYHDRGEKLDLFQKCSEQDLVTLVEKVSVGRFKGNHNMSRQQMKI